MLDELITEIVKETVKTTLKQLSISKQESVCSAMNTKQLSQYINMSVAWIYQNLNVLPYRKIGKKLIFNIEEINEFLEQRKEEKEGIELQKCKVKTKKIKDGKYKVL